MASRHGTLQQRLEEDVRAGVLAMLPCDATERAALEAEGVSDLLTIYVNWNERLIDPRPRKAHVSDALAANPLRHDGRYSAAFDAICACITAGNSLTAHLSRGIRIGYEARGETPKVLKRRPDLDLLLSDWGVHHLHLSTTIEADGFVARTKPLLLGVFHRTDAYLIDIIEHGDWTRESLMETVVRHWPNAGILYEMKGVTGLARPVEPGSRKLLREAGVNVPLEIGGKVYMSPRGISTAGTSASAAMQANDLLRDLDMFCERVEADPAYLVGLILRAGRKPPLSTDLKFVFLPEGYGVLETGSRTLIRLR